MHRCFWPVCSWPDARRPQPKTFTNPILTGMNPDPSICRVDETYYLVTSTFEYFPGLPIYQSKDLVHWKLIGHAGDSTDNNPLQGSRSSGGQYAATIRYHNGKFLCDRNQLCDRRRILRDG